MEIDDYVKQNPTLARRAPSNFNRPQVATVSQAAVPEKKFKRRTFLFMLLTSIAAQIFVWIFIGLAYISATASIAIAPILMLIFGGLAVISALGSIAYVIGAGVYAGVNA